jgi:hypothetical protein
MIIGTACSRGSARHARQIAKPSTRGRPRGFTYVLASERGNVMPSSEDALTHDFRDCALVWVDQ